MQFKKVHNPRQMWPGRKFMARSLLRWVSFGHANDRIYPREYTRGRSRLGDSRCRKRMKFRDRTDAGRRLAASLQQFRGRDDLLVLGLPRGGVPVAAEVARILGAPLDLCFAHKIGAPDNPEFAIGSVAETGSAYIEEAVIQSMRVPFSYVRQEASFRQKEMSRLAQYYRGDRPAAEVTFKCVILVDDGVATGSTAHAALQSLRARVPARLIFATPVAAADTIPRLAVDADELAVLHAPAVFFAVGDFYEKFLQVPDEEVIALLKASPQA
jgi:predicted phosphoribosyltransferase